MTHTTTTIIYYITAKQRLETLSTGTVMKSRELCIRKLLTTPPSNPLAGFKAQTFTWLNGVEY